MQHEARAATSAETISRPDLLSESEAATMLGVAIRTMRNWRWKGEGPCWVKLGGRLVRYRRTELLAFIEAGASGKAA